MGKRRFIKKIVACSIFLLFFLYNPAYSLPEGGEIISGRADISASGNTMNIKVSTDKMIANWQKFSIAQPEAVHFYQPSSSAIALNRVVGVEPSSILGTLTATGKLFLINPNGILFGPDAFVDTAGLVASTLNISDNDFLAGRYNFYGEGKSVVNLGHITSKPGGYVVLLGSSVENQGVIEAELGSVALASGKEITLNLDQQGLIKVVVEQATSKNLEDRKEAVKNEGKISVEGGRVILTAKALDGVFDRAVNNSGIIEAKSLTEREGQIILEASGAGVKNSGTLRAKHIKAMLDMVELINERKSLVKAEESITLEAKGSRITNRGTIKSRDINLTGKRSEFINRESGDVEAKRVNITMEEGDITNAGTISAEGSKQTPEGGIINLRADNIYQKGIVSADAYREGRAGEISIVSKNSTTLDENSITSSSCPFDIGEGGRIYIDSEGGDTSVKKNALIDVSGGIIKGNAGSMEISADKKLEFQGRLEGKASSGYKRGRAILDPREASVSGTYNINTTVWAEDNITVNDDINIGDGINLNLFADHKSESPDKWDDGEGAILNPDNHTISAAAGATNTTLNLKAGSGIGEASHPLKTNVHKLSAEINPESRSGDIYIAQGGSDLTVTSITTPGDVNLTASGSILDDSDDTTMVSGKNITLVAGGDIGNFDHTGTSLEEKTLPMLDVALGSGELDARAGGDIYLAEHNASTLFTSKYNLTSTGQNTTIGIANLTPHKELNQPILGVTLSPVGVGKTRKDLVLDLASVGGEEGVKMMAKAGIRTVRTYYPPSEDLLDAFAKYGIKVIVGFPHYDDRNHTSYYSEDKQPYLGNELIDISRGGYQVYIQRYKDHPAILMWELGNEYNYLFREHQEWLPLEDWWQELKEATTEIHRIDPNHPVSTTLADMYLSDDVPQAEAAGVDVIGLNCYRWDDYSSAVRDIKALTDLPMYLSEGGADSYDINEGKENQAEQKQAIENIWDSIKDENEQFLGITFMTWQDEWWKPEGSGNPSTHDPDGWPNSGVPYDHYANEEYWGWTTVDHQPKQVLSAIPGMWGEGNIMVDNSIFSDSTVLLISSGSILNEPDSSTRVTAPKLILYGGTGIGSLNNPFQTQVSNLQATNTNSGDINITNEGELAVISVENSGGDINLRVRGNLSLGDITAKNRTVTLESLGGDILDDGDNNSYIWTNNLKIENTGNIGSSEEDGELDTRVKYLELTADGNVYLKEFDNIQLRDIKTANGLIDIKAKKNITLLKNKMVTTSGSGDIILNARGGYLKLRGLVSASRHTVSLISSDSIIDENGDSNNVIATNLILSAKNGIGSPGNPLETEVSDLQVTNTGSGSIGIKNNGSLTLADLGAGYSVDNSASSPIDISATSSFTVNSLLYSAGNISLRAGERDNPGDDLKVNADIISSGGNITLRAGDDVIQATNTTVKTGGGKINITAGYNDLDDKGSIIQKEGARVVSGDSGVAAGDITLEARKNILLTLLDASGTTDGNVTVTSNNGSILDNDSGTASADYDIIGKNITLNAGSSGSIGKSGKEEEIDLNYSGTIKENISPVILTLFADRAVNKWIENKSNDNTVDVQWEAEDPNYYTGSGIATYYYKWSQSPSSPLDDANQTGGGQTQITSQELEDSKSWYFHILAVDKAGNTSKVASLGPFFIDTTPPEVTTGAPTGKKGNDDWYLSDVTVPFTATDNLSGFTPDGVIQIKFTRKTSGEGRNLYVNSGTIKDRAGNKTTIIRGPFKVDKTPPTITVVHTPAPNTNGWNNVTPVTVSFNVRDNVSGVDFDHTHLPPNTTYNDEVKGKTFQAVAYDNAGNKSEVTETVNIDTTPPQIIIISPRSGKTYHTPQTLVYTVDEDNLNIVEGPPSGATYNTGSYNILITAVDLAGNRSLASLSFNITPSQTINNLLVNNLTQARSENIPVDISGYRINLFNPTPTFYTYRPSAPIDYSAFERINLGTAAYEFIQGKIKIRENLPSYSGMGEDKGKEKASFPSSR